MNLPTTGVRRREPVQITRQAVTEETVRWLSERRGELREVLDTCGAIHLREAGIDSAPALADAMRAIGLNASSYVERTSPRRHVSDGVYTATSYPATYDIHFHNEMSYSRRSPQVIAFCCALPPSSGGETPISDVRAVHEAMPTDIHEAFARHGFNYVRNFDGELGVPWQVAFGVDTVEELNAYCAEQDIQLRWERSDWLRTCQRRPATRVWPRTQEAVWFNHAAFFHASAIPSEVWQDLEAAYPHDALPNLTEFGDGSPIPAAYVETIHRLYESYSWQSPWRRGDLLILNNVLWAHGRRAFQGPREVLTAFGDLGA